MRDWRLIIDGPVEGAWNMAIDRAVLHACAEGTAPPTLRLYTWRSPTVTLGRFQAVEDIDLEACRDLRFEVARRPTGGRGVLHKDELTYSIVTSVDDGVPRGVSASYRYLCAALAAAYAELGVGAELTSRPRGDASSGACYLHATHADLSLGAAKLSGSAQAWDHDAVLQHGSFVRSRDVEAEARVFKLDQATSDRLVRETAALEDALGVAPALQQIGDALVASVGRTFGVNLVPGALTEAEVADALERVESYRVQCER